MIMINHSPQTISAPPMPTLYVWQFAPWRRRGLTTYQIPQPFEPCCDFSASRLVHPVDPPSKYIDPPSNFRFRSALMSSINVTVDSLDDDLRDLSLRIHGQCTTGIPRPI